MNDLRTDRCGPRAQALHTMAEPREASFVKRLINSVIHSITGESDIGFRQFEHLIESPVQVGTGKLAISVSLFG